MGGVGIIKGLEMVRYNIRGWNNQGEEGCIWRN